MLSSSKIFTRTCFKDSVSIYICNIHIWKIKLIFSIAFEFTGELICFLQQQIQVFVAIIILKYYKYKSKNSRIKKQKQAFFKIIKTMPMKVGLTEHDD